MPIRFRSTDAAGDPFEWKLERNGNLYARAQGRQRWLQIGKNFTSQQQAEEYILGELQGHREVQGWE